MTEKANVTNQYFPLKVNKKGQRIKDMKDRLLKEDAELILMTSLEFWIGMFERI